MALVPDVDRPIGKMAEVAGGPQSSGTAEEHRPKRKVRVLAAAPDVVGDASANHQQELPELRQGQAEGRVRVRVRVGRTFGDQPRYEGLAQVDGRAATAQLKGKYIEVLVREPVALGEGEVRARRTTSATRS